LSYFLPILIQKYPDAIFIHLQRERESCIKSLAKRPSLLHFGAFHLGMHPKDIDQNIEKLAEIYYDNTVKLIEMHGLSLYIMEKKYLCFDLIKSTPKATKKKH
jgi:hypothetical protein